MKLTEHALQDIPSSEQFCELARDWNNVTDLAVMLEALYWPHIAGSQRRSSDVGEDEWRRLLQKFRVKVLQLVEGLDPIFWKRVHESLRLDAAWMDDNPHLYMLLRVAAWDQRKNLRGRLSGALWIRHMAEVIRRGFEEAHDQRWPEEYEAFGYWVDGARRRIFGSERPLDDVMAAKPYLAREFGLFTGSTLRWYLEGDTEYFAVWELLTDPSKFGIEVLNLKGAIASGKNNTPLGLEALLKEDCLLRRFSMVSFDRDVPQNVKFIRRQIEQDNVVGMIAVHDPDYEFANFSVAELAEVAARIDEAHGFSGAPVRTAGWTGVANSKAFESQYKSISARRPAGLKGEEWGRALARYAVEHPCRPEGQERPLWHEVRAAVHAWASDYGFQREDCTFDRMTFEVIPRKALRNRVKHEA